MASLPIRPVEYAVFVSGNSRMVGGETLVVRTATNIIKPKKYRVEASHPDPVLSPQELLPI
jgi:hypothetical protein